MRALAVAHGFSALDPLLNRDATISNIKRSFSQLVARLQAGDILFWSLAGHGRVYVTGDEEEKQNQAFCAFDGYLVDDDIYTMLASIPVAARVVIVTEVCYSGSLITTPLDFLLVAGIARRDVLLTPVDAVLLAHRLTAVKPQLRVGAIAARFLGPSQTAKFLATASGWRHWAMSTPAKPRPQVTANVILLAACHDTTLAAGPRRRGVRLPPYTTALVNALPQSSSYLDLQSRLEQAAATLKFPIPVLNRRLTNAPSFLSERPFQI